MELDMFDRAYALADKVLSGPLPRRWRHVKAVAAKAERLAPVLADLEDREALKAAAVLHDIGYAPDLATTGFHPLDGARWLRATGFNDRVAALVAHHTNALVEAQLRGLDAALTGEFDREDSPVVDLLWYCDLTTGPDGQDFTVACRIVEIQQRYEPGSVVRAFIDRSTGVFHTVAHRVESRLTR